ncbi:MAG: hypothetical protein MR210_04750 [Erysipelotrichaceae bacterium]|nr:hypothetical protein [Erysipelotrichaceae bacterium]MDY5252292.1 hypothetical protein [Erysipelotrichaceae bacterium]
MVKKILVILLVVFLSGCSGIDKKNLTSQQYTYQAYYTAIKENNKYVAGSEYFDVSAEMSELPDGKYLYYVFIDNPRVAMFNIKAMVMENSYTMNENDSVLLPTVGIFDDSIVNMVPYQVNTELGFQKGIVLSGEATSDNIVLDLIVTWDNNDKSKSFREFYQIELNMSGYDFVENVSQDTKNVGA